MRKIGLSRIWPIFVLIIFLMTCGWVAANPGDSSPAGVEPVPLAPFLPGSETRLLPANYDIWSCDWAPGGKSLVFAGKMQGEDAVKMRIWYWPTDPAADPTQLTNTDQLIDFTPRWSPDGTCVVMTRRSFGKAAAGSNSLTSAIWLKDISNGSGRQLTQGPEDRDPFWSPDGKRIVFSRGHGPYQAQLGLLNPADGSVKLLYGGDGELISSPYWGRDGKIYFTKQSPAAKTVTVSGQNYQVMDFGRGSIWAINPEDGKTTAVIEDEYDNRIPALSPDGTRLAFVSDRPTLKEGNGKFDRGSLIIKDLKPGRIYLVTTKVGLNGGSLSFSPDGKKLAFFTFRSIRPSVWVVNLP